VKELKAVPAEADEDDEEWRQDGCTEHSRFSVMGDPNVAARVRLDGCGEVYFGPDEAEAAGRALLDCARNFRALQRSRGYGGYQFINLELEWHSGPPPARES
jgi:hypothetical protein